MAEDNAGVGSEDLGGESADLGDLGSGAGDPGSDTFDLEQVAADFEAEALEEMGAELEADPSGEGAPGPARGTARSRAQDALDALVESDYGGDRNAALRGIIESRAEGRHLAERIKALETGRTASTSTPRDRGAEVKTAIDSNAEVQAIDQDIRYQDDLITALPNRNTTVATNHAQVEESINKLVNELNATDDQVRARQINTELLKLNRQAANLVSEFTRNEDRIEAAKARRSSLSRERARAAQAVKDGLDREEYSKGVEQENLQRTRRDFAAAVNQHLTRFDLDPKSESGRYVAHATKLFVKDYLDQLGPGAFGLDSAQMDKAVRIVADDIAKKSGIRMKGSRSPVAGRQPVVRRVQVRPGANIPQTPPRPQTHSPRGRATINGTSRNLDSDDVLSDPKLVRERASAMWAAAAKAQSRRQAGGGRS